MSSFDHQVAGHAGNIVSIDDLLIKKETHRERFFYEAAQTSKMVKVIAKYHGHKANQFDSSNGLVLQNVIHKMSRPNLIDLKLGKILYGTDANEEKRLNMIKQAKETTSEPCGMRICGMKVYNNEKFESFDKSYGRSLTKQTINLGFVKYFNGCNQKIKQKLFDKVKQIHTCMQDVWVRCGGVSLLLAYELESEDVAAILMDFAHAEFVDQSLGVDADLIWGLECVLAQIETCMQQL
jgi:1D-myo-inositol-tetrakisphosphate 5-kinase/inositol-polyphosphate multikinase